MGVEGMGEGDLDENKLHHLWEKKVNKCEKKWEGQARGTWPCQLWRKSSFFFNPRYFPLLFPPRYFTLLKMGRQRTAMATMVLDWDEWHCSNALSNNSKTFTMCIGATEFLPHQSCLFFLSSPERNKKTDGGRKKKSESKDKPVLQQNYSQ